MLKLLKKFQTSKQQSKIDGLNKFKPILFDCFNFCFNKLKRSN